MPPSPERNTQSTNTVIPYPMHQAHIRPTNTHNRTKPSSTQSSHQETITRPHSFSTSTQPSKTPHSNRDTHPSSPYPPPTQSISPTKSSSHEANHSHSS